jgi:cytochrome c
VENRSVGPSFREIAEKYAGLTGSVAYLTSKIRAGGSGLWGSVPMPVQNLSETDAQQIAQWIAFGAAR